MTYDELLELARRYEGTALETVTGRKFTVGVYLDCPFFTPESTGNGQRDGRKAAERFLALYSKTGSLRPGDYASVTRNASYYVGTAPPALTAPLRVAGSADQGVIGGSRCSVS
jgi:hypothetical protein